MHSDLWLPRKVEVDGVEGRDFFQILTQLSQIISVPTTMTSKDFSRFTCFPDHQNKTLWIALFLQALAKSAESYAFHVYYSFCPPSHILILLHHSLNLILSWVYCTFTSFYQLKSLLCALAAFCLTGYSVCHSKNAKFYHRIPGCLDCSICCLRLRWWLNFILFR